MHDSERQICRCSICLTRTMKYCGCGNATTSHRFGRCRLVPLWNEIYSDHDRVSLDMQRSYLQSKVTFRHISSRKIVLLQILI